MKKIIIQILLLKGIFLYFPGYEQSIFMFSKGLREGGGGRRVLIALQPQSTWHVPTISKEAIRRQNKNYA